MFNSSERSDHKLVGETKLIVNKLCDKQCPVQTFEVACDLHYKPGYFEDHVV